jgi:DNA-binding NarL/FixJ family response regulator
MLRDGTRALLETTDDIDVVGTTGEGKAAIGMVEELKPDVLVLDVRLPDLSGIEIARSLAAAHSKVAVQILTVYDDVGYFRALMDLGVKGYLKKTASGDEIIASVRAVAAGKVVLESGTPWQNPSAPKEPLTNRETEILREIVAGRRNSEISKDFGLSIKTVEFHIGNLLEKLGALSRAEVMIKAREMGMEKKLDNQPD